MQVLYGLDTDATPGVERYVAGNNAALTAAGMNRVAEVASPTTSYTDTTVVNDIDYYYVLQAASASV